MLKSSFFVLLALLGLSVSCSVQVDAAELLVPEEFTTIQSAIEAAQPLDQIVVSPGTYVENLDFLGKSISLLSSDGPDFTIIDGSALTRGPEEGSTIVFATDESPLAILNGFTIQGGSGKTVTDLTGTFSRGGGIRIQNSSPTILNCVLKANHAQLGAGIHASGSIAMNLLQLSFRENSGLEGAGAYLQDIGTLTMSQCSFLQNNAQTAGGGLTLDSCSAAEINFSVFENNDALIGGALDSKLSLVQINYCEFQGNEATLIGGAIAFYQSSATLADSHVTQNVSGHGAGIGIDSGIVEIYRCVIADNFAASHGGAIATTLNPTTLNLNHVTLANNLSFQGTSGIYFPPPTPGIAESTLAASHSIFWNPSGQEIALPNLATTEFCNVEGGYTGVSMLDTDPLFTDSNNGDYSLHDSSPCIDAGSANINTDPDGTLPDLGAIWNDQRPDSVTDLICELSNSCDNTFTFNWNLTGPADAIVISIGDSQGNQTPVTSLPGNTTSWSTILNQTGTQMLCVEPINNGMIPEEGATCCEITVDSIPDPILPTNLTCTVNETNCAVEMNWSNGEDYSSIEIQVNGAEQILGGDVTSAIEFVHPNELTTINLTAFTACGEALSPISCQVLCDPPVESFIRGDSNADGNLQLSDVFFSLDAIFGLATSPCPDAQDTNDDGNLDISDPLMLLMYLFGAGAEPPSPGNTCGQDPAGSGDPLDCPGSPGCP
ncbi:MAG: right-handed parallel beta-helix repeat-containing protein [Planctomycetota bacterium]